MQLRTCEEREDHLNEVSFIVVQSVGPIVGVEAQVHLFHLGWEAPEKRKQRGDQTPKVEYEGALIRRAVTQRSQ